MAKNIRVFYIGLHPQTLTWINEPPLNVVGVSKLEYFSRVTLNPINIAFRLIYSMHERNKLWFVKKILFFFLLKLSFLCTSVYKKYLNYLREVIINDICIIDVGDTKLFLDFLKNSNIDLIIINSWSILPTELLSIPLYGTINIHPSKLPQYRGSLPTLWSLKNKDSESAVTYVLIDKIVDGGNILSQYIFQININDNSISIEKKIDVILQKTLHKDILAYLSKEKKPIHQSGYSSGTGRYDEYRCIVWQNEFSNDIYNKVFLYPYLEPYLYTYTKLNNRHIYIKNIYIAENYENFVNNKYRIEGLKVVVKAKDRPMYFNLFKDVSVVDSFMIVFNVKRMFD